MNKIEINSRESNLDGMDKLPKIKNHNLEWKRSGPIEAIGGFFVRLFGKDESAEKVFQSIAKEKIMNDLEKFLKRLDIIVYYFGEQVYIAEVVRTSRPTSRRFVVDDFRISKREISLLYIDPTMREKVYEKALIALEETYTDDSYFNVVRFRVYVETVATLLDEIMDKKKDKQAYYEALWENVGELIGVCFGRKMQDFFPMIAIGRRFKERQLDKYLFKDIYTGLIYGGHYR